MNVFFPDTLEEIWRMVEDYHEYVRKDKDQTWDLFEAFDIMGVDPYWFVDERSEQLVTLYQFYSPNPSQAFPGSLQTQPALWILAKSILDFQFESKRLNAIYGGLI